MIIGKKVEVDFREKYTGTLIHFGIGYDELRDGIGHFTEAIVMTEDGQLHNCPANCVRVLRCDLTNDVPTTGSGDTSQS